MDSINPNYSLISNHKLQKQMFSFFLVNFHSKIQFQITLRFGKPSEYLSVWQILILYAVDTMFNLCLSMWEQVRPEWWIRIWPVQQALQLPCSYLFGGADSPISQLLSVLVDTPGHLPSSLWPITYRREWKKRLGSCFKAGQLNDINPTIWLLKKWAWG